MESNLTQIKHYFRECLGDLSVKEITQNETMIKNANRVQNNFDRKLMEMA